MLLKCPECELQVSDKASFCPHCGFPMKDDATIKRSRKRKKKRLPNGFGQITEIKGRNLRKPFRAMINDGFDEKTGRPISRLLKPVSYFETYNDAYAALIEYHKNPFDVSKDITVEELYEKWLKDFSKDASYQSVSSYKTAWRFCSDVSKMKVVDVRPRHIKGCVFESQIVEDGNETSPNPTVQINIKSLFNLLFDYALEYEIVATNYSRSFTMPKKVFEERTSSFKEHLPYTDEEIRILWEHLEDTPGATEIIIQCYSGWRPRELCELLLKNVDLDKMLFKGGLKTEAGKNRVVPIHSRIQTLVRQKYEEATRLGSEYLFNDKGKPLKQKFGFLPEHRLHDGRKHFVTMAKKYKVDEYAIKYIVGHAISDLTEKTYTKRDFEWLREEIEKIK